MKLARGRSIATKTRLVSYLLAAFLGTVVLTAPSSASETPIFLKAAPPAVRLERVPPARDGSVWIPGYWDIRGSHHVWRHGHWEPERHGYKYIPAEWVRHDDRWELKRGRWEKQPDERLASTLAR